MSETEALYPARQTEYLDKLDVKSLFAEVTPLTLSENERQRFFTYESALYDRLKSIKDIKGTLVHDVFPVFFTTEEGWKRFQETYGKADEKVAGWERPANIAEATSRFFEVTGLDKLTTDDREDLRKDSQKYARDQFEAQYEKAQGDLSKITNPVRVARIPNPAGLTDRVNHLREFKRDLKRIEKDSDPDISPDEMEARHIIARIYRRYVNTVIADAYDQAAVLMAKPNRTPDEDKALSAITRREVEESTRFTPGVKAARTMERIDHFLNGVGLQLDKNGNYETIPQATASLIEEKAQEQDDVKGEKYNKFAERKVNFEQGKKLIEDVLESYGLLKSDVNPDGWSVKSVKAKNMAVREKKDGEYVRNVELPETFDRNFAEAVRVFAHEVEGHVLRNFNGELLKLKILKEYSTGRTEPMSEGACVWVEEETMKQAFDEHRATRGVYYFAMRKKQQSLSFKQVYKDVKDRIPDKIQAFRRAYRLFYRGYMSLSQRSKRIINSDELSYHEPIAEKLAESGLTELLFLPNVDVYSLFDIARLGIVDFSKIKTPKFKFAELAKQAL